MVAKLLDAPLGAVFGLWVGAIDAFGGGLVVSNGVGLGCVVTNVVGSVVGVVALSIGGLSLTVRLMVGLDDGSEVGPGAELMEVVERLAVRDDCGLGWLL